MMGIFGGRINLKNHDVEFGWGSLALLRQNGTGNINIAILHVIRYTMIYAILFYIIWYSNEKYTIRLYLAEAGNSRRK